MSPIPRPPLPLLVLVGAAALAIGGALLVPGCGGGALITVAPPTYDFGRVLKGDTPEHTFTLTNHSDRVVGFKAQPNCACFTVNQGLRALDPGQSLQFNVRFNTLTLPPQKVKGKWITIHTDHPDLPGIVVPLEGEIYRAFTLGPETFNLGRIDGRPVNYEPRVVSIRPLDRHAVRITGHMAVPEIFDVETEEIPGGGVDVRITLQKQARRPVTPFIGYVHLDLETTAPGGEKRVDRPTVELRGFWFLRDEPEK